MVTGIVALGAARRGRATPRSSIGISVVAALLAAIITFPQHELLAAEPASKAATNRATRDEAARGIPFDKLSAEARSKVSTVINDASLYRRLPVQSVDCEPELFHFLLCNPDLLVNIWHVMGITNVVLDRVDADHYRCTDGDGTTARVEVLLRSRDTQIVYADGFYDGPLFPRRVRGQCVCVLKHVSARDNNGRFRETVRLDTFLRVDNVGIEMLAKLFQGLVGRTIDHNFAETVGFLGSVSRTAETNPRGMRRLAARLDKVEPQRREQFVTVTDHVAGKLEGVERSNEAENPTLAEIVQSSAAR